MQTQRSHFWLPPTPLGLTFMGSSSTTIDYTAITSLAKKKKEGGGAGETEPQPTLLPLDFTDTFLPNDRHQTLRKNKQTKKLSFALPAHLLHTHTHTGKRSVSIPRWKRLHWIFTPFYTAPLALAYTAVVR
uniref:Uncharacterized protein n=1 Tax=Trypanosoma congolense (strain IL3000) TaxID=1068625 RepID=G0UMD0_TRYCI|nr:hypothetical protein, unlikely [Trypanosoma congolense IL3000]